MRNAGFFKRITYVGSGYADSLMSPQQMRSGVVCIDRHTEKTLQTYGFGGL